MALVLLLAAAFSFVRLAADGHHHWDEPTYLYAGAYLDARTILEGQVQPSGLAHFTQGRILHALLARAVMHAAGSPPTGFRALVILDLLMLAACLVLVYRLLRELLPEVRTRPEATVLLALSPVVLYLAFRTLADTEALLAALLATWALLRLGRGAGPAMAALAAAALCLAALAKNQMTWLPGSFWLAMCAMPIAGIDRRRLARWGAASGLAGIALTVAVLEVLGVGVGAYASSYLGLAEGSVPLAAKALSIGTELGPLWLLVPVALLTSRRRELAALALWLAIALAPFVFVINSIEARHVAVNLVAAGGLFALALEVLERRWFAAAAPLRRAVLALAAIALLAIANRPVLMIMPHRVDVLELRELLDGLDLRYGAGGYVLLSATGYTDFQIIRVLWPDVDVRDASTADSAVSDAPRPRAEALASYYQGRAIGSVEALQATGKPAVYLGYRQTFAAENLHAMLAGLSPRLADRVLGRVQLPERLFPPATAWLWQSAQVRLVPAGHVDHYRAYDVQLSPRAP